MDRRLVEFIRTLRAAGVRISVAESGDAFRAVDTIGVFNRDEFQAALRTTLVKEAKDLPTFDHFFPLFFDTAAPPMFNMEQELTPDQQQMLQQALQALMGDEEALRQLLQQMMRGQGFSPSDMDEFGEQAGLQDADSPYQGRYYQRRMERAAGLDQLRELLEQLAQMLAEMGMSEEAMQDVMGMMQNNAEALAEQLRRYAGTSIARNLAERELEQPQPEDSMHTPFRELDQREAEALRDEVKRLAARLRSRAALRHKKAKAGDPDPKSTIRHNLRYGGTPLELQFRNKKLKPRLVVICDISTSMRYCSEFMLTMIYELQDQVARARSFIFIDDLHEISDYFTTQRPDAAVEQVLNDHPPGSYNTDLGHSLDSFFAGKLDSIDSRTTVIIVGDGRNNYNDPRIDLAYALNRRARRVLWFNPEPDYYWGTGDSDMLQYAPVSAGVYQVANLAQLVAAIDRIMSDG